MMSGNMRFILDILNFLFGKIGQLLASE